MAKLKMKITESSDVNKELAKLNERCLKKGLPKEECERIIMQVKNAATDLVKRGHELVAIGSQFQVSRAFNSSNINVTLEVTFGNRSVSFGDKLRSLFIKR